jgi:hypothetical protein
MTDPHSEAEQVFEAWFRNPQTSPHTVCSNFGDALKDYARQAWHAALLSAAPVNARAVADGVEYVLALSSNLLPSERSKLKDAAEIIRRRAPNATLPAEAEQSEDVVQRLLKELGAKQAELDRVMFEHCPDEMTPEQIENWKRHQVVEPTGNEKGK